MFQGYYLNNQASVGFGTSLDGTLSLELPLGASYDSYNTYLYVNVIDNDGGVTTYQFGAPIQVNPNPNILQAITEQLLNPLGGGAILNALYSGNSQLTTQTLLTISSVLNDANITSLNTVRFTL